MGWLSKFLTSSIGQKLIMSLTGLFLVLFLVVHLAGNLTLLAGDNGKSFNIYADFMVHNPLIKATSFGLYFFILLHAVQGIIIKLKNNKARGSKYLAKNKSSVPFASNNMALLGILIFAFLCIHMGDFWFKMKLSEVFGGEGVPAINYDGAAVKDIYSKVVWSFSQLWIVIVYLTGLVALFLHLWHGFESAFQTLGLNHKKYTPFIKGLGKVYSILIPIGFAILPIYIFLTK